MRRASPPGGFTLLEVLAAVAILALVYTVLAGAAIQGLRAEGESDRRLRASLLADEILAEMEAGLAAGTAPPLGSGDSERGDYRVHFEVENFQLPPGLAGEPEPAGTRRGAVEPAPSLLTVSGAEIPAPLRVFRVEVSWGEAFVEHRVDRTSYGFDLESARNLLEQIPAAGDGTGAAPAPARALPGEQAR